MKPQGLTVLGATGSIGVSTLDVAARHPDRFKVVALTGHNRLDVLASQCRQHRPQFAVVRDSSAAKELHALLSDQSIEILWGGHALEAVASLPEVDSVMAAIVGAAGLLPTLAAVKSGKRVLLANKEALVMAGGLFMDELRRSGSRLLPVDSEHNAIFQSLPYGFEGDLSRSGVRKILLTASGGPFRTTPIEQLRTVTPDQACAHPKWVMGRKISVDSATMMNKGLEVIEAHWLFSAAPECIEVVIHPQSVIHSLVEYVDGSVIAQLGNPDMRTPIAHALAYPERVENGVSSLDLFQIARLDFERPDLRRFPCLEHAYKALNAGGTAPALLNAANEVAVAAFLDKQLPYLRISDTVAAVLDEVASGTADQLDHVLEADRSARDAAVRAVQRWRH